MKIMKKQQVSGNERIIKSIQLEKQILMKSDHPFILKLYSSFQTRNKLYIVTEYMENGDLYSYLQKHTKFDENTSKFIIAQIILGIEYLHEKLHVIYRDLKPENVLIDQKGFIKLADFGLSKEIDDTNVTDRENAPLGTPQYLAPEMVLKKPHNKNVDLWTIGILLYELIEGKPPFGIKGQYNLYKQILTNKPNYENFTFEAQDLISKLLQYNPNNRLGAKGYQALKKHSFFFNINWDQILLQETLSPFIKYINKPITKEQNNRELTIYETPQSSQDAINFDQFTCDPQSIKEK